MARVGPSERHYQRLGRLINRSATIFRWEGMLGFIMRVVSWAGLRMGGWYVLKLEADSQAMASPDPPQGVTIRKLRPSDQPLYLSFRRGSTEVQFSERLKSGNQCFGAFDHGQLCSVSWTAVGHCWVDYLRTTISMAPDEFYVFDSFTSISSRGKKLQSIIMRTILSEHIHTGYKKAVTIIGLENQPNITSRERSGFRRTALIGCILVGPWRKDFTIGNRKSSLKLKPDSR